MRFLRVTILIGAAAAAACKNDPVDKPDTPSPSATTSPGPMTDMDPASETAWEQARAIAARASVGELKRRSSALPFMFMAKMPSSVLVHRGVVVREKGPAVAGAYLRDLGIVRGQGPGIDDILYVFHALDAWPPVKDVHPERFVNVPGDKRLADLTAQTKHDDQEARVVLHYFLPGPAESTEDDRGDSATPVVRRLVRATLRIPETGDASWRVERISWTDPAGQQ